MPEQVHVPESINHHNSLEDLSRLATPATGRSQRSLFLNRSDCFSSLAQMTAQVDRWISHFESEEMYASRDASRVDGAGSIAFSESLLNWLQASGSSPQLVRVTFPRAQVQGLDRSLVRDWIKRAVLFLPTSCFKEHSLSFKILPYDHRSEIKARSKVIQLGAAVNYRVVLHELGHFIECTLPGVHELCQAFVIKYRNSDIAVSLRKLTLSSTFEKNELAYPGNFLHPYVGKIFSGRYSEVLSMGLEQFSSPKQLSTFIALYPEHFKLTLGVLLFDRYFHVSRARAEDESFAEAAAGKRHKQIPFEIYPNGD
jgi:hypothetical protein